MAKYAKPPARVRYEQKHPTVSFRLNLDTKKRLKDALEGQSFASFIKEALGVKEKEIKSLEEAYKNGYAKGNKEGYKKGSKDGHKKGSEDGYKKGSEDGYAEARKELMVTYNCNVCGEPLVINQENEKQAANQYMSEHGWGHITCH